MSYSYMDRAIQTWTCPLHRVSVMIDLSELRKDRTKYDAGRKRSGRSGNAYNNMKRRILAIDGEGVTDADGRHRYILLASSDNTFISGDSLATVDCLDYLLNLPGNRLTVGFSLNYDICKWLKDLPREALEILWERGSVMWEEYSIRWAPTKFINIKKGKRSIRVYDVFGFYQQSFVKALEEWKVGTSEQVERITNMKASRSQFTEDSFNEILKYCLEECELLVQMVDKLRKALLDIDITLHEWYGAGAIATAIFQKENVKQYLGRLGENGKPMGPSAEYSHPIMSAYYGGRFELARSGEYHDVYSYDIRSAYPYIASTLPCLSHLTYSLHRGYKAGEWNLYYVSWQIPEPCYWGPFPFRIQNSKQILCPPSGNGWYHASEVESARRFYGDAYIHVEQTLALTRHCDHRPFAFIPEYFAYRDRLKREGHQGQLTIKLGLNSLYGKMAQGVGWGTERPPYQSYLWAGMITAGTRGMLLDAIAQKPEAIIATATDGIVSLEPLRLDVGSRLGQWEISTYAAFFSVQSGVYETWDGIPYVKQIKSRGFGKAETSFDEIKKAHHDNPISGTFEYRATRFVGLGAALVRTEFWRYFGQWIAMDRRVNFDQMKRWPSNVDETRVQWLPYDRPADQEESHPYSPRSTWTDLWSANPDDLSFELLVDDSQP